MTVEHALRHRKSCRAFLDRPVDSTLLRTIIEQASRAPSNGNLQPWQIFVLTGSALASLKATTREAIAQNQPMSTPEYAVYPKPLKTEFDARRFAIGEDIYRVLGITREDKAGRRAQFAKNALIPRGFLSRCEAEICPLSNRAKIVGFRHRNVGLGIHQRLNQI